MTQRKYNSFFLSLFYVGAGRCWQTWITISNRFSWPERVETSDKRKVNFNFSKNFFRKSFNLQMFSTTLSYTTWFWRFLKCKSWGVIDALNLIQHLRWIPFWLVLHNFVQGHLSLSEMSPKRRVSLFQGRKSSKLPSESDHISVFRLEKKLTKTKKVF